MQKIVVYLLLLLASTSTSYAQEAWTGNGIGMQGCGQYIENRRTPNQRYDNEMAEWFYGFLTGRNYYSSSPQIKRSIEASTVLAYLDKYCRENPLASVGAGALELVKVYAK